jgi:hypothetical protein
MKFTIQGTQLEGYSDSNWTTNAIELKTTGGYIFT